MSRHLRAVPVIDSFEPLESRTLFSGDHPSLSNFPSATSIALVDNLPIESSVGQVDGVIGTTGDDDLFTFVAPYSGRTAITVAQTAVGGLAPAIQLFDASGNALSTLFDGVNGVAAVFPVPLTSIVQGQTYYVNVRAGTPSDTNEPAITGAYRVIIVMEIPPQGSGSGPGDNVPVPLPLDQESGAAQQLALLVAGDQVDTYAVTSLAPGAIQLRINTPASELWPSVSVTEQDGTPVATATGIDDSVQLAFLAPTAGRTYLVHIGASAAAPLEHQSGVYVIEVTGTVPGAPAEPPSDYRLSNAEIAGARPLGVNLVTGLADTEDYLVDPNESDVYTFRALRTGQATIGVQRLPGSSPDVTLGVFADASTLVAFDRAGGDGWLARLSFNADAGRDYYVRVRPEAGGTGAYALHAISPLSEYSLFYPEGYSSASIDEYVPIINPNSAPVAYTLIARYEVGERDQIIATGTIPALSRGGVTITSRRTPGGSLVRPDTPYALELRSDAPLGATLSHYDFGVTTGENFTNALSTSWAFAEAHRDPAVYRDFLVYFNPNPSPTEVRVSLIYDDGSVTTFARTIDAFRRGGINFTTDSAVTRPGNFSVRVNADQAIVAALSSYDIVGQRGYGLLGDAEGGSTRGAIPILAGVPGARPNLSVFNPATQPTTVTLRTSMLGFGDVERVVLLQPGRRLTLSSQELGISADAFASLSYTATNPVVVSASEYHTGDGDATAAGTRAASAAIVADAFVNPSGAGSTYYELLSVYNPLPSATQVNVTLLSEGGVLDTLTLNLPAFGFRFVRVDQMSGVLNHQGPVAFSVRVDSTAPVVAAFEHYDLFLDGGWSALGAPIGLTTPLWSL